MRKLFRICFVLLLLFLLLCLLGYGLFRSRYFPVLSRLAQEKAKTATLSMIDDAIAGQIQEGSIRYDRIVFLEKDVNGRITALKTNMQEINRLKSLLLSMINKKVLALDTDHLGISAGSLLLP